MYAFAASRERGGFATLLVRLEDPAPAIPKLQAAGVKLVESGELYRRLGV
jgi:hypothetical protein